MPDKFYWEAVKDAIREEMIRDETVFVMGEDVGIYGGAYGATRGLYEEFGEERVRDTAISEAAQYQHKYQVVRDSFQDALLVVDPQWKVQEVNAAAKSIRASTVGSGAGTEASVPSP